MASGGSLFASLTKGISFVDREGSKKGSSSASKAEVDASLLEMSEKAIRRKFRIFTQDSPALIRTFDQLSNCDAPAELISTVQTIIRDNLGWASPTAIQMASMPCIMPNATLKTPFDTIASAETGSGKTGAFLVPVILGLGAKDDTFAPGRPRACILAPTRELADQTARVLDTFISNGVGLTSISLKTDKDVARLTKEGCDVLVCTPYRLGYLIKESKVDLTGLSYLVLDEADRLLDRQFLEETDVIIGAAHGIKVDSKEEQTLRPELTVVLFSATISPAVESVIKRFTRAAINIKVGVHSEANARVKQELKYTGTEQDKLFTLRQLTSTLEPPVLVFTQSKDRSVELSQQITSWGVQSAAFHSDLPQRMRDRAMSRMSNGDVWCLVTTDLMARGIDFEGVKSVVNYDFPTSGVAYIHRIGRTGRSVEGKAVTLFTDQDSKYLKPVTNVMKASGCTIPPWMDSVQSARKDEVKRLVRAPLERDPIVRKRGRGNRRMKRRKERSEKPKE